MSERYRPTADPYQGEEIVAVEVEVPDEVLAVAEDRRRRDRSRFERKGIDLERLPDLEEYLLDHLGVRFEVAESGKE